MQDTLEKQLNFSAEETDNLNEAFTRIAGNPALEARFAANIFALATVVVGEWLVAHSDKIGVAQFPIDAFLNVLRSAAIADERGNWMPDLNAMKEAANMMIRMEIE